MNNLSFYLTTFTLGLVGYFGVKTGEVIWDRAVEPKLVKKSK